MITVLIHYKKRVESSHPMLCRGYISCTKVVEVEKLIDLNDMFNDITKIEILSEKFDMVDGKSLAMRTPPELDATNIILAKILKAISTPKVIDNSIKQYLKPPDFTDL